MRGEPISLNMYPLTPDDPSHIGPYRLLARLGAGGMGRVYLARSEGGRTVAVKLVHLEFALHPEFRRRFAREVAAARKVGGEWTAPVLDADTEGKTPWVATGYVPGPPLNAVVEGDFGPLPSSSVHVLAHRLGLALQAIHEAGLVHRDLKPANILLTVDGPRVIDFGLAHGYTASLGGSLTAPGAVLGTPAFMSPEQVRGETVTQASDVFSLGSVLTYAATGRLAFQGSDPHSVMYHIAHEEPELTGVPDGLVDLVRQCLAKEPQQRPAIRLLLDVTRHAVARAWLPGELLARLGRDAARLLDAEVHLAGDEPMAAVSVPPHATTFPDMRDLDEAGRTRTPRDPLDVPEAGIRPPSLRPTPAPKRRPWVRIALPGAVLAAVAALLFVPSVPGLGADQEERSDPLAGRWGGSGQLVEGQSDGYAQVDTDRRLSKGSFVDFVLYGERLTCWGTSRVLSRRGNTAVLGRTSVNTILPKGGAKEECMPGAPQTLSLDHNGTVTWKWSIPKYPPLQSKFALTPDDGGQRVPSAYVGTWDSGKGLHLTIRQSTIEMASIDGLTVRSGTYCVWSSTIPAFSDGKDGSLVYGPASFNRSVSDKSCHADGPHRLTLSRDGGTLALTPYTEEDDAKSAPPTTALLLRRVN